MTDSPSLTPATPLVSAAAGLVAGLHPLDVLLVFAVGPLLLAWFTAFKTAEQQLGNPWAAAAADARQPARAWTVGRWHLLQEQRHHLRRRRDRDGDHLLARRYAFARLRFPGQKLLLYSLLIGLTIPVAAIIIPLYVTMRDFHLLNTYGSVIIADIALAAPIFVFIMRAFFKDLPPSWTTRPASMAPTSSRSSGRSCSPGNPA